MLKLVFSYDVSNENIDRPFRVICTYYNRRGLKVGRHFVCTCIHEESAAAKVRSLNRWYSRVIND